jgi:PAS domain S-box-containing protein
MIANSDINVLLVDDRYDGVLALQVVLKDMGYNLVTAASGREALECLSEQDFAVILLDVQMPIMDGFETAENIKKNANWRHIPIIFVTAINKHDHYVDRGYTAGAVDYIFKPFEPHILLSKVNVLVDLYRKTKEVEAQGQLLRENERLEQKRKIDELELKALRRYQRLADAIPGIVCKSRADGKIDYLNRAWSDYTGMGLEESIGDKWQAAFDPTDLQVLLRSLVDTLIKGTPLEIECRILHGQSGEWRWNVVRAVADKDAEGKIHGWIGTAVDIHDRKKWEDDLARAKEKAEQANHAKSAFLANMSHEIRTPLNAIMGFSELLLEPNCNETSVAQNVSIIRRNGQQLMKIIDEILDISRVEANRMDIHSMPTDVEIICNDLRTLFMLRASEKGLALNFEVSSVIPKIIETDAGRFRQVMINVIGNALKFTNQGSITVTLGFEKAANQLVVRIRDTGIGMPGDQLEKLFVPFSQIDVSTTRQYGGTGLGLALSRKLAEALGGSLTVADCALGEGSTFEIRVAAGNISESPMISALRFRVDEQHDELRQANKKAIPDLKGLRVLLAEDAPDNQNLISRFLGMAGAEVHFAENGLIAFEKAMSNDYNLVLMDIQMPVLDGYEATRRLRESGYLRPIVALTAHALREERQRCIEIGCTDHLTKPVNRRELIEQVSFYSRL